MVYDNCVGACIRLWQGAGLLGVYGVALLKEQGFSTVYCSDVHQGRLNIVQKFGATIVSAGTSKLYPWYIWCLYDMMTSYVT